ncbi:sugar phosphate isomerase/epimerase family protein [Metabacillus iocasae]|uniref:3-dehydroshikimate dehydratase n=1 Tax=Priestia iocasae TaxID=2291674 RepID=A0ABS2QYQ6_9BACI|nr:sugar phosphate isomerase/epimerase family protein [Metabacillus iocasae]MBM7704552.1 3-dehydroshikimate dehydratase [Metabacillus iocasae]
MNLSICTISFRHHLHSIDHLADWAQSNGFTGIELWGIHAKHLADEPSYNAQWLQSYGLQVSMLSDYFPLEASSLELTNAVQTLSSLGHRWGTKKLRTFAGQKASAATSKEERAYLVKQLRLVCELIHEQGQYVLVETHPNTLTDTLPSTLQLLEEVNHPALRVNFDVLHMWESGADPIEAFQVLQPFISHFHFKNITSRDQLNVFAPQNVYAAAGSREGMVPLFEGAVDYHSFLSIVAPLIDVDASLEWFGPNVKEVLASDCKKTTELVRELTVSAC